MAKATKELIKSLTQLSRIGCPEPEQDGFLQDLNQILGYVEQLQELDTEGVQPCDHAIEGMSNVMREDKIGQTLSRKDLLDNAPDQIAGFIRTPSVLSNREGK